MRAIKNSLTNIGYIPLFIIIFLFSTLNAQQLAFPTAVGAGAYATGGRGGKVCHVNTLIHDSPAVYHSSTDSYTGGFQSLMLLDIPAKHIVFDVAGTIEIPDGATWKWTNLNYKGNITISGQTAPGKVVISTDFLVFQDLSNVIFRYLSFYSRGVFQQSDVLWIYASEGNVVDNLVVDHCSFFYGGDESLSISSTLGQGTINNVTVQNSLMGASKMGCLIGSMEGETNATMAYCAFVDSDHRFPNMFTEGSGQIDAINIFVENYGNRLNRLAGGGNFNVQNYYVQPNRVDYGRQVIRYLASQPSSLHSSGTIINGVKDNPTTPDFDLWHIFVGSDLPEYSALPDVIKENTPMPLVGQPFTIYPANEVKTTVLPFLGNNKRLGGDGSAIDDSYALDDFYIDLSINQVPTTEYYRYPTLKYPDPFSGTPYEDVDRDGMADTWEIATFGDLTNTGKIDTDGDGYTDLEQFLNLISLDASNYVEVSGVTVTPDIATINIPEEIDLDAIFSPENATNQSGIWSSSNESIATVSSAGIVTPLLEGDVTITFTTNEGGFTSEAIITVTNITIQLESVSIIPENVNLELGEDLQLTAEFLPLNTTDTSGIWSSSDQSIATVDDTGFISSVSEGEAEITFVSNDGGLSSIALVTVTDEFFGTYFLYNAESDQLIQNIEGDHSINLAFEGNGINFRSIPEGGDNTTAVESVGVNWTGQANGDWLESYPLYAGMSNHTDLDFDAYLVEDGTYDFTVTYYSENSGEGDIIAIDTFSLTFFFNTLPIADAGPDQNICDGETATLTASGGPYFLWYNGETTESIEVNPLETTTYSVTVFDGEGNTDEDSVTVSVFAFPTADAGEDQTICIGETVILTAEGGASYLWSNGETTASIEVTPSVDQTYIVEVSSNNCSSVAEVTVFVNEIPNIILSEDIVIFEGESTVLSASGSDNYEWSTGEITDSIVVNPPETTTYTVTSISSNGCSSNADITVTVIPEVIANAGEDVTICSGETVSLSAEGGSNYLWNTGHLEPILIINPTQTTSYTVTVEDDYGNTSFDEVTVFVNELPNITFDEPIFIMIGNSATLTAHGANSYLWETGETTAEIIVSPDVTTTYTVVGFSENGCESTEEVTVTVVAELVANAGANTSICMGESVALQASGGVTYTWDTGHTGTSPVFSPSETTTYTVTVTDGFGNSDSDEVTVTVNPVPIANAGPNQTTCQNESVVLSAEGGNSYLWSTGETSASITVSPDTNTTYTVEVFLNTCSDFDNVTVFVNPTPEITVSNDVAVVIGNSTTLHAFGGNSYIWNTGETAGTIVVSPNETETYTVTGFSESGCESTNQITVTVVPEVVANAGSDISICAGETAILTASGGSNYLWNTGQSSASITINPTETTTYSVTVSDDFGNSDTDSVTITVNELPEISVSNDVVVVIGNSTTLQAFGGDSYIWNTGETLESIVVSPNETETYTVTGFSENGCESTNQVIVTVIPQVIANAGNDFSICFGETATLTASGGSNYLWNTGQSSASTSVNPVETTTYSVSVTDDYGNSDTDSITITVNELPVITVSDNITIIEGENVELSAYGALTYLWNTGDITSTINVSPTQTTTYNVIGVSNSCESLQEEITVTVTPLFVASAGFDERVCDNQSFEVVLTAGQGDSYLWSTGETSQSIIVGPLSTTVYEVTVTQGEQQDTDYVTVYVDPSPNVVIVNGESVDILNGDFITLSASGANSYEWNNGATQPNIAVSPSLTTTYEVRGYVGDCYDDKQVTVNVLNPVVADAGDDLTICMNEFVTLTASGGDDYVWNTGETTSTIEVSPLVTTDYTVTVFNALDFDEATVRVEVDLDCTTESTNPNNSDENIGLNVYPNPALNEVNIKISGGLNVSDIHFYDVTGKLVHQFQVFNEDLFQSITTTIDISSLQAGVYFVKLINDSQGITKKLIVN